MKKRFLAIFIVVLMLFSQITVFASGIDQTSVLDETDLTNAVDDLESVYSDSNLSELIVLEEITELREANVKHFSLSNGLNKAVAYSQPVHYMDESGNWIDIDNSLSLQGNEYSTNNKFEIKFANKSASSGLLSIKDGDYKIDFTPLNTNKVNVEIENPQENNSRKFDDVKALRNLISKATYSNIYNGIDIEYILTGNNIKENIIVNSQQESYVYSFELKLNKLTAELSNGSIILSDSTTGEEMYVIPAPYMYDANGVMSTDVEYSLVQNNKWKYTFTVTANTEWINADERIFPVTIDPTIIASAVDDDTFIMLEDYDYTTSNSLIVGNFFGMFKDVPGFMKFNTLPDIQPRTYLVQAKVTMHISYLENTNDVDFYLGVFRAQKDWVTNGFADVFDAIEAYESSSTTDNYNNYVNTLQSYFASTPENSVQILSDGPYEWDITSLYKDWKNGTANNGICIKAVGLPENENANVRISTSEAAKTNNYIPPQIELTYAEPKGIEESYGYLNTQLGESGRSYVNLFNQDLIYINNLTTMENQELKYEVNLVYDSTKKAWSGNYEEQITLFENSDDIMGDNIVRYLWHDADGTIHYFTPYLQKNWWGDYVQYEEAPNGYLWATNDPVVFYPEDDIDYVLTKTSDGYFILKNYDGTQKMFDDEGRLIKICDNLGNVLYINNHPDGSLASIYTKDSNGEIVFLLEMFYWMNGKLIRIHDNQNQKQIRFGWTGDNMTSIRYHDMNVQNAYKIISCKYDNETENLISISDNNANQKIKYYTETKDAEDLTDDENFVELLSVNGNQEQTINKYIVGECFYKNLGNDFESNIDDSLTTFIFDNKGRKTSVTTEEGSTSFPPYDDSILPDASYYGAEYNQNIYSEGFNIVKYNVETEETELLNFNAQEISNTNVIETTETTVVYDNVDNTRVEPYNMVCQILAYFNGRENPVHSSGFLSGPNTIIMSGHAIREEIGGNEIFDFRFPDRIEVVPGRYIDDTGAIQEPFGIYEVTSIYIPKEYYYVLDEENNESFEYDWAVCVLDENIDEQLQYFDIMVAPADISNQYIEIIGYYNSTMYWSKGQIEECTKRRIYYNTATNDGISGSPIFFNNGNYTVIGIHTTGTPDRGGTKINSLIYCLVETLNEQE